MDRAGKLRSWARQCRQQAATTRHAPTADALLALARENELLAKSLDAGPQSGRTEQVP